MSSESLQPYGESNSITPNVKAAAVGGAAIVAGGFMFEVVDFMTLGFAPDSIGKLVVGLGFGIVGWNAKAISNKVSRD